MVISVNFSTSAFTKRWSHCHQLANYLARYASANEDEPERRTTLLSTLFNEMLEAIYRNHAGDRPIQFDFERRHECLLMRGMLPVDDASLKFYRRAVEIVNQPDPMGWYRDRLEHDATIEETNLLGFLELAVVYGSKLSMTEPEAGDAVQFTIEFPIAIEVEEP